MPTYAYACKECGHKFDAVQSFADATLTECPECGGALRKQYGSIGVTFNGSGFYRTDSRAGTKSASDAAAKPAATPAKSDSKPSTATPSTTTSTPASAAK
ncbi:FmdB family zinc ribbon protein [Microbacterium sp. R86528]|uniref:FmdB family zinc ribbon protein n=1 Tax=Microbacterium sp. R86528 TaxID=3093864 RepID=UPI0037C9A6E1